jgi:hypothetical protein
MRFIKSIIWQIDKTLLDNRIKQFHMKYRSRLYNRLLVTETNGKESKFTTYYSRDLAAELSLLCDLYGSDKGESKEIGHPYPWPSHSYVDYYSRVFWHSRKSVKRVFECGIGTNNPAFQSTMGVDGKPGASLRVWRDYFPNALIFGGDIDRDILFEEDRIKTFYIDQLNPQSILDFWSLAGTDEFDFMVDDGLHNFEAGSTLFRHSFAYLAPGGIYVIEDVSFEDMSKYKAFFKNTNYVVDFITLERPSQYIEGNCLVVIRK